MSTAEKWKYDKAYSLESYRLQGVRFEEVQRDIAFMPAGATYLDVGCGRGESLDMAEMRGVVAFGTELVEAIIERDERIHFADVCALPFETADFDYVSCYDVLEHLVPGDEQAALDELGRVCRKRLIITTNDRPSHLPTGEDLHINKRPRNVWHDDIVARWGTANVTARDFGGPGRQDWKWIVNF